MKYVVARPWKDSEPEELCIYTYGGQIQDGSLKQARWFLDYVERQDPTKTYSIYEVSFTKIK